MTLPRMPSMRLDGRRALVTGAGSGIGAATALARKTAARYAEVATAIRPSTIEVRLSQLLK